jgi:predicted porin
MKKTLLALAALAASSAAFAQSYVTLYGVMDASVESVKNNNTITRVSSDNLSSSRIGVKGSEDLGGGTKANFNLESAVKSDTGANGGGSTRFWDRAAWVSLAGGFGELRLGRTDTPIGDIAGNMLSAQSYDDLKFTGARAGNTYRRADNTITYFLPSLVSGLTASLQYSTANGNSSTAGAEATGDNANGAATKSYGLGVKYATGPFSAGIGYEYAKDEGTATGSQNANATLGYAGYDFGFAKFTAYYDVETNPSALTTGSRRMNITGLKAAVPFTPEFTMIASGSIARNVVATTSNSDVQIFTLKGIYTLSKRTALYGMFTNVNNDVGSKLSIATANSSDANMTAGKVSHGIAFGVRHSF